MAYGMALCRKLNCSLFFFFFSPFLLSFMRDVHLLYCFIPVRLSLRIELPYINKCLVYIVETTNVSGGDHKFAPSLRFELDGKVSIVRGMRGQLCFRNYASRSSTRERLQTFGYLICMMFLH